MNEVEILKARIAELEAILERALPVVRLTAYQKLAARIAEALEKKDVNGK